MALFDIRIKNSKFKIVIVSEHEDMRKGLSGLDKLGKDKGMLFYFKNPREVTMNMGGMKFPIDMLFIDKDNKVIDVEPMRVDSKDITKEDVLFVLEVAKGSGSGLKGEKLILSDNAKIELFGDDEKVLESNVIIKEATITDKELKEKFKSGGKIQIKEDVVKAEKNAMQVLDHEGRVLMNITGGERIFSREHTEQLINLAKQIEDGEKDEEELGKLVEEIIYIHNTQEPQYV